MTSATTEKRVPIYLSLSATVLAVGTTLFLGVVGEENPRKYLAEMTVNHHGGYYGGRLDCRECHVPQGAFSTSLGCSTAACHGELAPSASMEDALEIAKTMEKWQGFMEEEVEGRARQHVTQHLRFATMECWECHKEHKPGRAFRPEEWESYIPGPQVPVAEELTSQ